MNQGKQIDRRHFMQTAAAAAAVAACGGSAGDAPAVHARPRIAWRLASSFPRGLDTIYGTAEILAERLAAISDGYFTIRPYPAGELVPGLQVMDAVQQRTVPVGHTASYYYTGKNPVLAFDTAVPFGLMARQQAAWAYYAGGLDLMNEVFADFDILAFPAGNTGAQWGGWFKREVNSVADLRGLRMRIPGPGGEVMSRLGVTVQVLAGGDIYPALERGVIDATEWVGPYDDEKLGFDRIAKNYYYPGWWEPGPMLAFQVNRREWNALPVAYQEWFATAALEAANRTTAKYDAVNPPALERLIAKGVRPRRFSDDMMSAAHRAAFELFEEQASRDATYRKVYAHWKAFRASSYRLFGAAELAFASFAFPRA